MACLWKIRRSDGNESPLIPRFVARVARGQTPLKFKTVYGNISNGCRQYQNCLGFGRLLLTEANAETRRKRRVLCSTLEVQWHSLYTTVCNIHPLYKEK